MARILLIEDDDSMRRAIKTALTLSGYDVVAAINGVDGLDRFRKETFDLIVTDLLMSYGGLTTIRLLRRIRPRLGIIAISCSATHLEAARKLGANRTLQKPFSPVQLCSTVDEVLREQPAPAPSQGEVANVASDASTRRKPHAKRVGGRPSDRQTRSSPTPAPPPRQKDPK
jgi:DNA-binding response OmpR family regulator